MRTASVGLAEGGVARRSKLTSFRPLQAHPLRRHQAGAGRIAGPTRRRSAWSPAAHAASFRRRTSRSIAATSCTVSLGAAVGPRAADRSRADADELRVRPEDDQARSCWNSCLRPSASAAYPARRWHRNAGAHRRDQRDAQRSADLQDRGYRLRWVIISAVLEARNRWPADQSRASAMRNRPVEDGRPGSTALLSCGTGCARTASRSSKSLLPAPSGRVTTNQSRGAFAGFDCSGASLISYP